MIVVGSGAIGIEFAHFYNAMGTEVTIVEFMPNIVPVEDEDISKQMERSMKKAGVKIMTGAPEKFENVTALTKANVYFGGEILRLDRASGKRTGAATVGKADNLAWNSKAELLAVAHPGSTLETIRCFEHPGSTCTLPYTVWRINPTTMSNEMLFTHRGAPMGTCSPGVGAASHRRSPGSIRSVVW